MYLLYKYLWIPKTLNTKRSNVPHTHVVTNPESQISLCFALWVAIFELQAILRQVHQKTPKWPGTLEGHMHPIYIYDNWLPRTFHSFWLYGQPFLSNSPSWYKYTDSKLTLNTKRSKVLHMTTKVSLLFALWSAVFKIQVILRQVHWITPKWP